MYYGITAIMHNCPFWFLPNEKLMNHPQNACVSLLLLFKQGCSGMLLKLLTDLPLTQGWGKEDLQCSTDRSNISLSTSRYGPDWQGVMGKVWFTTSGGAMLSQFWCRPKALVKAQVETKSSQMQGPSRRHIVTSTPPGTRVPVDGHHVDGHQGPTKFMLTLPYHELRLNL